MDGLPFIPGFHLNNITVSISIVYLLRFFLTNFWYLSIMYDIAWYDMYK